MTKRDKQQEAKDTVTMILVFAAALVAENLLWLMIFAGSALLLQSDKLIDELKLLRARRSRR